MFHLNIQDLLLSFCCSVYFAVLPFQAPVRGSMWLLQYFPIIVSDISLFWYLCSIRQLAFWVNPIAQGVSILVSRTESLVSVPGHTHPSSQMKDTFAPSWELSGKSTRPLGSRPRKSAHDFTRKTTTTTTTKSRTASVRNKKVDLQTRGNRRHLHT